MENELFEKTPVPKAYISLSLPLVMGMIVTLVYNMVDTWFIALTGVTELVAGVSLAAPIFTLMIAFGDIFAIGGSSLISRYFGQQKNKEAKQVSAFSFWSSIVFGICTTVVLLVFRNPILHVLGADEATMQYASGYYTWVAIGATAIILGIVPANLLRAEGLAKVAMVGSMIGTVINIILDPIFIFGLNQGAAGAAMATILGNAISDIYYIYAFFKYSKRLTIRIKDVRLDGKMPSSTVIRQIFMVGIPASITNIMQSLMLIMTNKALLPYGTEKIAAFGIAMKVNMITTLVLVGFAFGAQPLIGYNYGAKNSKRLKEILRFAYLFPVGLAAVMSIGISLLAPAIIRLFMSDAQIVESGALILRCQQLGMVFMAVCLVSTCVCQSVGNALGTLLLSISRQGIIYFVVLAVLGSIAGYHGVILSQAASDLLTALMAACIMFLFFRGYNKGAQAK